MRQFFFPLFLILFVLSGLHSIWSTTLSEEEPIPKVYLNHFFRMVDAPTYKDIVGSDFIKNEFAHFEERTTVVNEGQSYSGAYIYGENTYFEFFEESKSQESATMGLTSAIALGVEKKDEIKIIQKKLIDYKNAFIALRTREWDGVQIPWFSMSAVFYGKAQPDIMTWVMEYHEDFLKQWHPDLAPSSPGITRRQILKRYAAKIARPDPPNDKILKDVIQVNLNLNQKDLDVFTGELSVLEYKFSHEGNISIGTGPDVKLIIDVIGEGRGRITGIKMSCRPHRHKEASFRFGEKSRLVLHADNTATWTFE